MHYNAVKENCKEKIVVASPTQQDSSYNPPKFGIAFLLQEKGKENERIMFVFSRRQKEYRQLWWQFLQVSKKGSTYFSSGFLLFVETVMASILFLEERGAMMLQRHDILTLIKQGCGNLWFCLFFIRAYTKSRIKIFL